MKTIILSLLSLFISIHLWGQELSKDRWSIKYFSSEETSGEGTMGRADQIVDGNLSTYWHSRWTGAGSNLPHEIQIDLGDSCSINGIKLWPRQNNCSGKPVQYEYYISKDGTNWGTPVASGTFNWASGNDNNAQSVTFGATKGRYIRFRQLSTYSCGSGGIGCISEIAVTGEYSKYYAANPLKQSSDNILPNSTNNIILPILVEVYDSKPLKITNLKFSTNGTTDLNDISEAKVYVTGASSSFNTSKLFGASSSIEPNMSITGDLILSPGSNHLWITYDVATSAMIGNYIDAVLESVTVSDSIIIPTVANPSEKRMIMGVQLTEFPVNKQLYPRNRQTNKASVTFAGTITDGNHSTTALKIAVLRGNVAIDTLVTKPQFQGDIATFSLDYSMNAELQNYSFNVFSENNHRLNLVYTAQDVVAGDAYIITGQSNAVATIWWGETTTELENPFVRSYGSAASSGAYTKSWFKAVTHDPNGSAANGAACDGQIGVLGLSIAKQLIDTYSVPIAILNGAHGGKEIAFFSKNKANPTDITTNYGRLLNRLNETKLKNNIEAVIWFQGETDGSLGTSQMNYATSFTNLRSSWKEDLSALKNIYVFQIKQGCGAPVANINAIQESQRLLPTLFNDVKIMSTNPVAHQEGCHFPKAGYITHATNLLRLIKCDFYNHQDTTGIKAPDIKHAALVADNQIGIITDSYDGLVWENGAHNDFKLHNTSNTIVGGRVENNTIYLTTSSPFTSVANVKISYTGRGSAGSPAVKNKKGVGLLCFNQSLLQKKYQEIDFKEIPDSLLTQEKITLNAVATSGLPITYRSSDATVATVEQNVLWIHKQGSVIVTASQIGNEIYRPAEEVSIEMHVGQASDIEDTPISNVKIYPNPVDNLLSINCEDRINSIEILTESGSIIRHLSCGNNSNKRRSINVSELNPGIYLLQINCSTLKIAPLKFIKK